jgi:hypothetical protein
LTNFDVHYQLYLVLKLKNVVALRNAAVCRVGFEHH